MTMLSLNVEDILSHVQTRGEEATARRMAKAETLAQRAEKLAQRVADLSAPPKPRGRAAKYAEKCVSFSVYLPERFIAQIKEQDNAAEYLMSLAGFEPARPARSEEV